MYKILRIIFCALAVAVAAVAIFVFVYAPRWEWGLVAVGVGIIFGALMVLFKRLQEKKEFKENPPPPKGDFITGKVENKEDETK